MFCINKPTPIAVTREIDWGPDLEWILASSTVLSFNKGPYPTRAVARQPGVRVVGEIWDGCMKRYASQHQPKRWYPNTMELLPLYMKWIDVHPFSRSVLPSCTHQSPEVAGSICPPHLSLRSSFSSVMICESTYCGCPGYAERNALTYEIRASLKVNTGPPNCYVPLDH